MPTPAAMSLREVPSKPCSAKQWRASARIASRVEPASPSFATSRRVPAHWLRSGGMDIVAALFVEGIDLRNAFEGGPALIDLTGVHFSVPAPSPPPVTMTPHLVVLVRCRADEPGTGVLEVVFRRADGAPGDPGDADDDADRLARN